jgi:hypothetical protein
VASGYRSSSTPACSAPSWSGSRLAERYEPLITRRPAFISFQTVAELRFGALRRQWGAVRMRKLEARIARAEVVHSGPELVLVEARLRVACERAGAAWVFSFPGGVEEQAAQEVRLHPAGADHRQAAFVRRCPPAADVLGGAPQVEVPRQPSGELASTDEAARAGGASLPLARRDPSFLSAFSGISPDFRPGRHKLSATDYRTETNDRFQSWNEVTGAPAMAA